MAQTTNIRVGTYGREIEIDTKTDLSVFNVPGCQTLLRVEVPDTGKSVVAWTATIKSPPEDGILTYTLQQGDLDKIGHYKIHAELIRASPPLKLIGDLTVIRVIRLHEERAE